MQVLLLHAGALRELVSRTSLRSLETTLNEAEAQLAQCDERKDFTPIDRARLRAELHYERGMFELYQGHPVAAHKHLRTAQDHVNASGDSHLRSRVLTALARVLAEPLRNPAAFEHHRLAIELMSSAGDRHGEIMARANQAVHQTFFARPETASAVGRELRDLTSQARDADLAYVHIAAAYFHLDRDEPSVAAARCSEAQRLADRLGLTRVRALAHLNRGIALQQTGRTLEAIEDTRRAAAQFEEVGEQRLHELANIIRAGLLAENDQTEPAIELLDRAETALHALGDLHFCALADLQRGQVDLAHARSARKAGQQSRATERRRSAESRIAEAQVPRSSGNLVMLPLVSCCAEARWIVRSLNRRLAKTQTEQLCVARDGSWIRLNQQPRFAVADGPVLRRALCALVEQRLAFPGVPMATSTLIPELWPGERMVADSGSRRVRDLIKRLRRGGLHDVLLTGEKGGYYLDPALDLTVDDSNA